MSRRVSETVTVSARTENFATTAPVATTVRAELVNQLPSDRSLNATMLLAPNVSATGPGGNNNDSATQTIVISGAMSFENLFLVNGVVGQREPPRPGAALFIEDAIQETTVTTGRCLGRIRPLLRRRRQRDHQVGRQRVLAARSGPRSPTTTGARSRRSRAISKVDDTIPTYEFTVGGPVLRDRIWFFGAGACRTRWKRVRPTS